MTVHFSALLCTHGTYSDIFTLFRKKLQVSLHFLLLETREQMVRALYELSYWRGYLVKILRPIGHTSKKVFHFFLFYIKVIVCYVFLSL